VRDEEGWFAFTAFCFLFLFRFLVFRGGGGNMFGDGGDRSRARALE
jgi:hypothetical protein